MTKPWILACVAALSLSSCGESDELKPTSEKAAEAAGDKTLASGLDATPKFAAAIKAAGLEGALAGPTPYTVLAPSDAAFDALPAGALDTMMKPEARKELTAALSNHILPGTMLTGDIAKAIDAGGSKAAIRSLGGGTLTATRDGDKIIFSDASGAKGAVIGSDERSNGVVHRIDGFLLPAR